MSALEQKIAVARALLVALAPRAGEPFERELRRQEVTAKLEALYLEATERGVRLPPVDADQRLPYREPE